MSTQHGAIDIKPIGEVAYFLKSLIPVNIPDNYAIKPMFEEIANEENIRSGVVAFRDFLYLLFDRLITDGHLYAKPQKKTSGMADYPFLHNLTNMLVDIGYHGILSENGQSLSITNLPLCTTSVDKNGRKTKPKIAVSSQAMCLRFLTLCGFDFNGIDIDATKLNITDSQMYEVSYPDNPALLTGLKVMSIADMELRVGRRYWGDNNLLRCDYRLLKAEDSDMLDVLKDFLHPLPEDLQKFAANLHQRYTDMGLTCVMTILGDVSFAYAYIRSGQKALSPREIYQRRIWAFSYSIKSGYCLFVRPKKTDKYMDIIEKFPLYLQEKISEGYGCYRKFGRERCQVDCQGICVPLDDSILSIANDIETWLDNEMPSALRK